MKRACLASFMLLACTAMAAQAAPDTSCSRRCLLQILWQYTEALTDNKPQAIPRAPRLRATSNGAEVALGKGEVWGPGRHLPFRHALVDPATGSAFFYGAVTDAARPGANGDAAAAPHWWFYALRLNVVNKQITEVEEVSYDGTAMGANPASLKLPDRIFDSVLPPDERSTPEELTTIADKYFDAVSGTLDYHQVPWHPECQRIELGVFTVNSPLFGGSCGGEFQDPHVRWIVVNRRFYLVDPERGLVLAIANFTTPPDLPHNNGSVVFELFKVQDGFIRQIQAFFRGNGQLHSGWGSGPGS
ncbi:MAG TPA: hypothetical protein VLW26_08045 [Steroidobacteraceae bacterium]|nr:hypothetical protein [Steroidobacteraceae bacterium]